MMSAPTTMVDALTPALIWKARISAAAWTDMHLVPILKTVPTQMNVPPVMEDAVTLARILKARFFAAVLQAMSFKVMDWTASYQQLIHQQLIHHQLSHHLNLQQHQVVVAN